MLIQITNDNLIYNLDKNPLQRYIFLTVIDTEKNTCKAVFVNQHDIDNKAVSGRIFDMDCKEIITHISQYLQEVNVSESPEPELNPIQVEANVIVARAKKHIAISGMYKTSTCDDHHWNKQAHYAMEYLQKNCPAEWTIFRTVLHGVTDWTITIR
jgi:hypothetical protein